MGIMIGTQVPKKHKKAVVAGSSWLNLCIRFLILLDCFYIKFNFFNGLNICEGLVFFDIDVESVRRYKK